VGQDDLQVEVETVDWTIRLIICSSIMDRKKLIKNTKSYGTAEGGLKTYLAALDKLPFRFSFSPRLTPP
jgi:hypothetical protein